VELIDYIHVLVSQRILIVAIILAGAVVGAVVTPFMTREYDATVSLLVSVPKVGDAQAVDPSVPTYRALIMNRGITRTVLDEFGLREPPYSLTWEAFLRDHLSVDPVIDTNIVEVTVSMRDPQLAAEIANKIADLTVDLNSDLTQAEYVQSRDEIKDQLDATEAELKDIRDRLLLFRKEARIEMLDAEARALLADRDQIHDLVVDIETERARLQGAETEIANHEPRVTVNRSIDSDVAALEVARQIGNGEQNPLRLELRDEFINPVHQMLQEQIAGARTTLAALERRREELAGTEEDAAVRVALDKTYEARAELESLQLEFDLTRQQYSQLASRYDQAELQVLMRSASLQTIDEAVPPNRQARPRLSRNILTGLVIALIAALPAAVIRDEFQGRVGGR
jgi:uncharacterized protein involved in exopolysaccharide biosynthesis